MAAGCYQDAAETELWTPKGITRAGVIRKNNPTLAPHGQTPKGEMRLNGLVGWRREGNAKVAAGHNRDAAEAVGADGEWPKGGTHKGLLPKDAWADQRECVADGMRRRKGNIRAVNAKRRAIPGWY